MVPISLPPQEFDCGPATTRPRGTFYSRLVRVPVDWLTEQSTAAASAIPTPRIVFQDRDSGTGTSLEGGCRLGTKYFNAMRSSVTKVIYLARSRAYP